MEVALLNKYLGFYSLIFILQSRQVLSNRKELECLVCQSIASEIEDEVSKVDPKKLIQVRSYRLDAEGNPAPTSIPYARSESFLSELMDGVCSNFEDYAQGTHKRNGRRALIRITTKSGQMHPDMSNYDLLPDPEENSRLKFHCERILEDYEDDIIQIFAKNSSEPAVELCENVASVCETGKVPRSSLTEEEEYTFEEHEEL